MSAAQKKEILPKIEDGLKKGGLGIGFPIGYYTVVGADDVMEAAALARKYNQFITSQAVSNQIGLSCRRPAPSLRRCAIPSAISTAHPR